ncbi:hypothetical protein [Dactylosporangium sp. NPDC000521]|uniref:hypothetical protein n=1 Tax=Dactylosporangium sp. NPDC000521 TaxID=3363975 RepID=UPI0036BFD943
MDADGREWQFVDKVPIFTAALGPDEESVPIPVHLRCDIEDGDDQVLIVTTGRDHVAATDGTSRFRVRRDQVEQHTVQ